jgi:hypothetical protein
MTSLEVENHFTVFVRLPFNRGDFVDPPPVNWSATKERALWDILSRQQNSQIDWKALAERFEVTQPFLLQKAAWLYERQLSQVRAQMRRVGNRNSATSSPSPGPGSVSGSMVGGQAMGRVGSTGSRVPSRLSTQHVGSPVAGGGDSTPGTPVKSRTSLPLRTTSTAAAATAVQQARLPTGNSRPLSRQSSRDAEVSVPASQSRRGSIQHQVARSPGQARANQPESSSSEDEMTQSRITTRRPNPSSLHRRALSQRTDMQPARGAYSRPEDHNTTQQQPGAEEDDDDDDEPSFLPFANPASESKPRPSSSSQQDPSATLRGALQTRRPSIHRRTTSERIVSSPIVEPPTPVQQQRPSRDLASSTSSLSSPTGGTNPSSRPSSTPGEGPSQVSRLQQQSTVPRLGTPLSPTHRALLGSNQPSSPRRGPGSDSASPSMGSSFSDLDDASVTQSALEEALLSGMGNTTMTNLGGFGGRVTSGIGQALRSRYFDARGEAQGQGRGNGGNGGNGGQGGVSER